MKYATQIIIILLILIFPGIIAAQTKNPCKLKDKIISDYKNFYSPNNLWKFALGIGYSAIYANTSFDREVQNFYNDYIKSRTTDNFSKIVKPFGDGRITVPIYLTAALIGEISKKSKFGSTVGEWGQRCSRALIVGAPPVLILQIVLGASRPEEGKGSHWHPFKDNNGVSGHSFMGAVPFLVAAKMTDNSFLKYPLSIASTFTGISRINDSKHYYSQAILGWWIAFLSVNSIKSKQFALIPSANGIGVVIYF